jgi:hypothetical protein
MKTAQQIAEFIYIDVFNAFLFDFEDGESCDKHSINILVKPKLDNIYIEFELNCSSTGFDFLIIKDFAIMNWQGEVKERIFTYDELSEEILKIMNHEGLYKSFAAGYFGDGCSNG